MNRSKVGLVLALFLLAAGMGSASVLGSFGVISGEADVEGPSLYAASGSSLLINEEPSSTATFSLEGNKTKKVWESDKFFSDDLGSSNWYDANLDFYIRARLDEEETDLNQANLKATLYYFDDGERKTICSSNVNVDTVGTDSSALDVHEGTCTGTIGTVDSFQFVLEPNTDESYFIYTTNGDTRIEVNAQ